MTTVPMPTQALPESPLVDPATPTTQAEEAEAPEEKVVTFGSRGYLEALVKKVLDDYVMGDLTLEPGKFLTPHRIAAEIDANLKAQGVDHKAMSTGSVDALIKRWRKIGYIDTTDQPFAFKEFTPDALAPKGLEWCKKNYRASNPITRTRKPKADPAEAQAEVQGDSELAGVSESQV